MRENQLARDIVANLARRFGYARTMTKQNRSKREDIRAMYLEAECEAWNAYASSRLLLLEQEVED